MKNLADENFKENLPWEEKAKRNPLFAVMSDERFSNVAPDKWTEEDVEAFFAKGRFLYDVFLKPVIRRLKLEKEEAFIVEYGSGMGRILKAISADGYKCGGIDISPTMLEYSKKLVPAVSNLSCIDKYGNCSIPSDSADFVYSYAVIQHIEKLSLVKKAISEMCRILKPDCYMKFQYRSIQNNTPFRKPKSIPDESLYNFEDKSLLIKGNDFKSIEHNNWLGVPLSFHNLESFLNENDVVLVGLELDVGKKGNMLWALGKKVDHGD